VSRSCTPEEHVADDDPMAKMDRRLREALERAAPNDRIEALLALRPDAARASSPTAESANALDRGLSRAERRRVLVERLVTNQNAALVGVLGRLIQIGVEVVAGGGTVAALHVRGNAEAIRKAVDDADVAVASWERTERAQDSEH
jgi:hypothetical protein